MTCLRLLPRFRRAHRELEVLALRERWSRSEIEAWQLERLNAVWRHAVSHVTHYRELAGRGALPSRFSSLSEFQALVPILPRSALKNHPGRFVSDQAAPGAWHVSSGSTGTPTAFYWEHDAHLEALRCRYRMLNAWGVDIFDRSVFVWSDPAAHVGGWSGPVARLRQSIHDRLRHRLRLPAYRLAPADLRGFLCQIEAFHPVALYAYTTAAYLLAVEAESHGCRPESLRIIVLSGEPASPRAVEVIERAFGAPAPIEYGATECPVIASEGPDRVLRVREDLVLLETLPAASGRYDLVLTVLGNPSFPLLRYAIGDMTDAPVNVPSAGFGTLTNVVGRSNDVLVARSGRLIHPTRFDFLFGFSLARPVRRYRVHQTIDGAVRVTLEMSDRLSPHEMGRLQREFADLLEGYPVVLAVTEALPASGRKHRWTRSDRSPTIDDTIEQKSRGA